MAKTETGAVYFIDIVPGQPDLITVRGEERLLSSDAVIYDENVPLELLLSLPDTVEKQYVGGSAEDPGASAEEIAALIEKLAERGLRVARLKAIAAGPPETADPEIQLARQEQAPVEVISAKNLHASDVVDEADGQPLTGLRVMVTRPFSQAAELYRNLRALGADPMPYPTIFTDIIDDENGWAAFEEVSTDNAWLIFTSENGVEFFFESFIDRVGDLRDLGRFQVAAVGPGTARALDDHGLAADFVPKKATVEDLVREMPKACDLSGAAIIRVRGNLADETVETTFPQYGAEVIPLTVYRTEYAEWPDGFREMLLERPPQAILFTSGSTVDGLYHNLDEDEVATLTSAADIFSLGPSVSKMLDKYGIAIACEAEEHTIPGLLAVMVEFYRSQKA